MKAVASVLSSLCTLAVYCLAAVGLLRLWFVHGEGVPAMAAVLALAALVAGDLSGRGKK